MLGKRKAPHLLTQGEGPECFELVGEAYHSPPLSVKRFTGLLGGNAANPPHTTPVHFKGAWVGGVAALPCLYVNNVNGKGKKKGSFGRKRSNENPFLSSDRKAGESLFLNASALLSRGVDRCAFVTITTPQNLSYWTMEGWKEARKRFRGWTCGKGGLSYVFGEGCDWCRVIEPQKRGAIHWHLLLDTGQDIRTGCDFEAFNRGDYRTAPPALRGMWARMRESMKGYKLGRPEIMPVKSDKWEAAARYCGKYICKGVKREQWEKLADQKERPAHTRRVGFSRGGWRVANPNFAWIEHGEEWRNAVGCFARRIGVESYDGLSELLGKKWAFYCHEAIWDVWEQEQAGPDHTAAASLTVAAVSE